ncbi:phage holin [Oceanobacillus sp. M65]|uniref:Phage holin n=1 Tax=Oceanobacillus jordanicus TaxID=2867266 RepID=A0AAW5B7J3_9BACI|nr:phage holin [Oceanobacillus iheyensis]MCG3420370.1 phage holin [Oceanobacillus jordanicus]
MDRGTLIRSFVLFVALINQTLVIFGKSPLPIDSELVEQFVAVTFTMVSSLIAWFKNNYITEKGKQQRKTLENNGLTKLTKKTK